MLWAIVFINTARESTRVYFTKSHARSKRIPILFGIGLDLEMLCQWRTWPEVVQHLHLRSQKDMDTKSRTITRLGHLHMELDEGELDWNSVRDQQAMKSSDRHSLGFGVNSQCKQMCQSVRDTMQMVLRVSLQIRRSFLSGFLKFRWHPLGSISDRISQGLPTYDITVCL